MSRATNIQKAQRLNRARHLLRERPAGPGLVRRLAQACGLSTRQAYRYLEQARQLKQPVPVGEAKVVFTVKLPPSVIRRVKRQAATLECSISEVVQQALQRAPGRGPGRG